MPPAVKVTRGTTSPKLRPEGVVRGLVGVDLLEAGDLAPRKCEGQRLVLVEGLAGALPTVAMDGHDLVVAFGGRALELGRERALGRFEELAVVAQDVVDALVLARARCGARGHLH